MPSRSTSWRAGEGTERHRLGVRLPWRHGSGGAPHRVSSRSTRRWANRMERRRRSGTTGSSCTGKDDGTRRSSSTSGRTTPMSRRETSLTRHASGERGRAADQPTSLRGGTSHDPGSGADPQSRGFTDGALFDEIQLGRLLLGEGICPPLRRYSTTAAGGHVARRCKAPHWRPPFTWPCAGSRVGAPRRARHSPGGGGGRGSEAALFAASVGRCGPRR